jgi:hypothetical protein
MNGMNSSKMRRKRMDIKEKINNCKTMKELDSIRLEVTEEMFKDDNKRFYEIQNIFRKQKNRIRYGRVKR